MGEENKRNNGGGENTKNNNVTVVLKADLHCEGCASKVIKCIRSFDGVDAVTTDDGQKITVVGKVDPDKLRERVAQKTHKKVELISPQPKKDGGGGSANDKSDQKKPKEREPPVTTAVFKVPLHCDGCIHKIYRTVVKTKGYADMSIDKQKDLVTVTGGIDMNALAGVLSKQMKRRVEIVQPKKADVEKKQEGGKAEGNNKMQGYPNTYVSGPVVIGDQFHYNPFPLYQIHPPQLFSDENPNACGVM